VTVPGAGECPDMFELPVDGDPNNTRWVFWSGNGRHLIGRFDGQHFQVEAGPLEAEHGANFYAAQTYSNIPDSDGRRIQIGWMRGGRYPGMPFNQQMSVPRVLTLRKTSEGVRLFINPVRELEQLRGRLVVDRSDFHPAPDENPLASLDGDLWDIELKLESDTADKVTLMIRGREIQYDPHSHTLSALGKSATIPHVGDHLKLRVLVDRTSIELFANDGRVVMSFCFVPDLFDRSLGLSVGAGAAHIERLKVWKLNSIWPEMSP